MVGGSTDLVVGVEAESMAAAEAGDGSTVGVMGAEVHGLTASRHLYQRTPSSGSLDSPPGCGNVLKTRTLEPGLQPAKILAFDPGEHRCSFAVSVAFDDPDFGKM